MYLQCNRIRECTLDTKLKDKGCQWLARGQWDFCLGVPLSSTNKHFVRLYVCSPWTPDRLDCTSCYTLQGKNIPVQLSLSGVHAAQITRQKYTGTIKSVRGSWWTHIKPYKKFISGGKGNTKTKIPLTSSKSLTTFHGPLTDLVTYSLP
jgi:hypothetical protein